VAATARQHFVGLCTAVHVVGDRPDASHEARCRLNAPVLVQLGHRSERAVGVHGVVLLSQASIGCVADFRRV
jgi:hypothetical protein